MLPRAFLNLYTPQQIQHWIDGGSMHALLTVRARYGAPVLPGWLALCGALAQPAVARPFDDASAAQDPHYRWLRQLREQLAAPGFSAREWFNAPTAGADRAVAMARQACGLLPAEDSPLLTPLERHLLSLTLANGALTPASPGHLQTVVLLVDEQAGGNEAGRLAWLHLWRLEGEPPLGERLVRAPQAQVLVVRESFQAGLDKVTQLLNATVLPNAPAVAWALQPLPLLSDDGGVHDLGVQQLGGASLSVAMAVGALYLQRRRLVPACGLAARRLGRLRPQDLAITAQLAGAGPPSPDPLQWPLSAIKGVGKKLHALWLHQTWPEAKEARLPLSQVWVAHDQDDCDRAGIVVGRAHTLDHLLQQASRAHSEGLPEAGQALLAAVLSAEHDSVAELSELQPTREPAQLPPLPPELVNAMRQAPRADLPAHSLQALDQHLLRRLAQWTGGDHLQFQHDAGPVGITGAPVRLRDEFRAIAIDIPERHAEAKAMRDSGKTEAEVRAHFSARTLQELLTDRRFGHPLAWVLAADPAAGKTTLLAEYELRTCWRALLRHARHLVWGEVALWVPLRQLEPLQNGRLRHAAEVMDDWIQSYAPAFGECWQDLFDGPLARDHGLVVRPLFDGVNELKCSPDERDAFLRQLMKTWWPERRASRPTPVFTVRTLERSFSLEGEGRATLRPWDEGRRNAYIDERLGEDSEQAERLKHAIEQDRQPSDEQKLYANPGMLALVCNLLRRGWISEPTANRAQLFACTLWMRLHDELHRTQDHPSESLVDLLHPQRERPLLNRLSDRLDQQLWVPPEQPGPLLAFLRDLGRRMQWPAGSGSPTMEITEDVLLAEDPTCERLLKAAESLHLLVREERRNPARSHSTLTVWRWAHQRWLEFWAAYGLTPDQAPADLSVPEGADLEAMYQAFLTRRRERLRAGAEDEDGHFTLPVAPINANEEVIAMAVKLRGQAVCWVKALLDQGNPESAARVALENWESFGELRDHPQDGWQVPGTLNSDGRVQTDLAAGMRRTHPVLNSLREHLCRRMSNGQVHISSRLRSGDLLGELGGDPRFEICGEALILKEQYWQPVGSPGGTVSVLMGDLNGDASERTPDGHLLQVSGLPHFELAGLLVTNAQAKCFECSESFDDPRWWPDEAGAWLHGNLGYRPSVSNRADESGGCLPVDTIFWWAQAYALWESEQRMFSSVPGSGVSPREVRSASPVRLPTEALWEAGARHLHERNAHVNWSYGHTTGLWDDERQEFIDVRPWQFNHFGVVGGGHKSPVGIFVESAVGLLQDMAGNSWELTSSEKTRYLEFDAVTGRANGNSFRVLRGGSSSNPASVCRSGFRLGLAPDVRGGYGSVGFRLARVVSA